MTGWAEERAEAIVDAILADGEPEDLLRLERAIANVLRMAYGVDVLCCEQGYVAHRECEENGGRSLSKEPRPEGRGSLLWSPFEGPHQGRREGAA